jgi:hypothetical protein
VSSLTPLELVGDCVRAAPQAFTGVGRAELRARGDPCPKVLARPSALPIPAFRRGLRDPCAGP